jgi:hypothetical protein
MDFLHLLSAIDLTLLDQITSINAKNPRHQASAVM